MSYPRFTLIAHPPWLAFLSLFILTLGARAATYEVGPDAGQLAKLSDVPWGGLHPGDAVNIHVKPGGYHEIIQISASGTAAQPILIRGIPDASGALPVIDGDGAVIDPHVNFRNPVFENLGVIIVTPRAANYIYGVTFPEWIAIESLDIRNARYDASGVNHFTDQHGTTRIYNSFACGIYIEFARHLAVRGCEISFNGNGVFANSKNLAAQSSADLLIEKNYFHDNGNPTIPGITNGFSEHHIYIESVGAVYQFNRFGPLRPNCRGCIIKDRSSGTIIRYNSVVSTDCSEIFAILDPQGGSGWVDAQPDYRDAFVYGNEITFQAGGLGGGNVVWFAALNGVSSYQQQHRGTLYFYHNTVVNHQGVVGAFFLTDPIYSGTNAIYEKVDARNNVFFTDTAMNTNIYKAFFLISTPASPTIDLGPNWVSPGTRRDWQGHPTGATVNGWNNLIVGDALGQNNPGFASFAALDYHLTSAANSIDAAGPLAAAALAKGLLVSNQYLAPQNGTPRLVLGNNPDLGAFETNAIYVPPSGNHAPVVGAQTVNLIGTAPVAIKLLGTDADADSLTYAYTTIGLTGTLTGTAPNLVYTPPAGNGSFIIAYMANDGHVNSGIGYVFVSFNAAGNPPPYLGLTSPAANTVVNAPANLTLAASAYDADGIKRIDFYAGHILVGSATTAPFTVNWSNVAPGTYYIVAKAFDAFEARAYSQPVVVTVK